MYTKLGIPIIGNIQRFSGPGGAIAVAWSPGDDWQLLEVRVHLSATGGASENLTISEESNGGSQFNTVFSTNAMASAQDVLYVPDTEFGLVMQGTTKLHVDYANTNNRIWGVQIIYAKE